MVVLKVRAGTSPVPVAVVSVRVRRAGPSARLMGMLERMRVNSRPAPKVVSADGVSGVQVKVRAVTSEGEVGSGGVVFRSMVHSTPALSRG